MDIWDFVSKKSRHRRVFSELIKFIIFVGFYYWLLSNGPEIGKSIIDSLIQLSGKAGGVVALSPSAVVDVGFDIWQRTVENLSAWSPTDSLIGIVMSGIILIMLCVIAVNMLLLIISAWFLLYAGIFHLGFGGSKWTSDIAINYYKTIIGIAVQLFTMGLIIGIGFDMLNSIHFKINKEILNFNELAVVMVFCLTLLMLSAKISPMLAGIITGSSIGGNGIGNFTAGAAVGAAMAAASTSTAMISNTLANAGGVADTLKAAFEKGDSDASQDTSGAGTPFISDDAINSLTSTPSADSGTGGGGGNSGTSGTKPTLGGSASGSEVEGESNGSNTAGNSTSEADSQASGSSNQSSQESSGSSISSALSSASKATGHAAKSIVEAAFSTAQTAARDRIAETSGGKVANIIREARENNKTIDEVDSVKLKNRGHKMTISLL